MFKNPIHIRAVIQQSEVSVCITWLQSLNGNTLMMQINCTCSSLCIYIYISSLLCTILAPNLSTSITGVELDLFLHHFCMQPDGCIGCHVF